MKLKYFKNELLLGFILIAIAFITIVYGSILEEKGIAIRRWHWNNLLLILPVVPLLLLQKFVSLPAVETIQQKKFGWLSTITAGIIFGLLDVLVIKCILHPQPYTELPPFLQPFPYSIFLYTSGALEIELYYRLLPVTLLLLAESRYGKGKWRKPLIILLGIVSSLVEPLMQWPSGQWWLVLYATTSGIAMNALQYVMLLRYGFLAQITVRLGHYLIWHILLGIYVQFVELAG